MEEDTSFVNAGNFGAVPNAPKTPTHNFRCPDPLWEAAMVKAKRHGETLTDVLIRALEEYVRDNGDP